MRRDTFLAFCILILILAALATKSLLLTVPPVEQTKGQFDAARAKARLTRILGDQRPHPADSPADDAVRARIVTTLQQMGLHPIVRDQMACNDFKKARLVACARIRNVIAALGPSTGKALLLSAHYDSVPVGPGASDDGIGVATLLEVGSILKDRPVKRPVLLLFNEGEELGLVGARAFLADPLSRNVDSLLNFEARGVNGPATMFETNDPNGSAIAAYASAVRRPFAGSLSTDVARLIPNDTDVTTFKERGWTTLNSAIVGNETRYHSPGDDLAGLDIQSLQDMGDEALALATGLSNGVPQVKGNRIFFDVSQRIFIDIPLAAGVVILLVLLVSFAFLAVRRGAMVRGPAIVLAAVAAGGVLAWLAVTIMALIRTGTYWRAHPEMTFVAIYAMVLAGELAVLETIGRPLKIKRLRAAYWFLFLLIGAALALVAPGGIIYFVLPPAAVLLGILAARWYAPAEIIGALVGLLLLYLTWGELLAALEELFSPGPLWVVAPAVSLMIAPALIEGAPFFRKVKRFIVLSASAAIALLLWIVVGGTPAYSQDHRERFTIEHVTEFPSARSSWSILNDGAPLPSGYSRMGPWRHGKFDFSERQRWLATAPTEPRLWPAWVQPVEIVNNGSERAVTLRLRTNGAERMVLVAPEEAHVRSAGVAGFIRPLGDAGEGGKSTISCTGRSCDGAELTIDIRSAKPVRFTVVGSRNGLPETGALLIHARPRFARAQYVPDETVTITHVKL